MLLPILLVAAVVFNLPRLLRAAGRLARDARRGADEVVARVAPGLRLLVGLSRLGRLEKGWFGSWGVNRG